MRNLAFILFIAVAFASNAIAQNSVDSIKTTIFDEVVVTGQYEPQSVDKSVYKIRTISAETMMARGAVTLQDALRTELNIRFEQDLATGQSNMTLQGFPGQNVKVLIDGLPLIGRQSADNSFNLNQININAIERIEIVEGPMSVIYGADALAGVINIITKKKPDNKFDLGARVQEESVGNEYGSDKGVHNQAVSGGYNFGKLSVRGSFARNFNGGYKGDSTGREVMWYPKTQYLGSGLVAYETDKSTIYYRADYAHENIYNPGNFGKGGAEPGLAIDANYISKRLMHQLQGMHKFNDRLSFNGAFAYTNYSRDVQITTVKESTGDVRLALSGQDVTKSDGATFRGTVFYKVNDKISLQPGVDLNYETGSGGRIAPGTHAIGDYGFFLTGEWSISRRVQIRPGLRVTNNTVYKTPPAMPAINAKIKLTEHQDLRLSYGRGFRAPSIRELYFYFYDASHQIEGNPNLKPETSNSFGASWTSNWLNTSAGKMSTDASFFYNEMKDRIDYGVRPGTTVTTLINIDRYKTQGVTLNNKWRDKNWSLSLGLGYTGRYNELSSDVSQNTKFQWSPEVTTNVSYRTTTSGWNFSLYYKYTGKLPYPEVVTVNGESRINIAKMNSYNWADLTIQKTLFKDITATAGVHNLLDLQNVGSSSMASGGAHSSGPVRAIGSGRGYFVSLTYTLNR